MLKAFLAECDGISALYGAQDRSSARMMAARDIAEAFGRGRHDDGRRCRDLRLILRSLKVTRAAWSDPWVCEPPGQFQPPWRQP